MLHNYPENFKRINTNASIYFSVVYELFSKNVNNACKLNFSDFEIVDNFEEEISKDYYIIIVFAIMTLEAFINDYLAVCLTDDFYYNNFDKLTIIQKIEILYSLIWEEEFNKSGELYSRI